MEDRSHPARVAACQVIVDRHQVGTLLLQTGQVQRQRGCQGFTFTGAQLGDCPSLQDNAADHLDVVVPHSDRAPGGLPHGSEGLRHEIFERFAALQPFLELAGGVPQGCITQLAVLRLEVVDPPQEWSIALDLAAVSVLVEEG